MADTAALASPLPLAGQFDFRGKVYRFAPFDTVLDPPAPMTFPNTLAWPAGVTVDVFVHGLDVAETHAPFGGWKATGTATVSADAKTMRTNEGVPVLSLVGLRRR